MGSDKSQDERKTRQKARKGAEDVMVDDLDQRRPAVKRTGESQESGEQQPPKKMLDASEEQDAEIATGTSTSHATAWRP